MKSGYPTSPESFVSEWRSQVDLRAKYDKGYGFGLDYNGVGSHPAPEGDDSEVAVTYPYTAVDGQTIMERQVTGERTWDVNSDGAAHYGLVPDWIRQLQLAGGGDELTDDLMSGAQTYLDTWAQTVAYTPPTNLATGRLTQASSQEWTINNRLQAKSATDGNSGTRWASGNWGADPPVDPGRPRRQHDDRPSHHRLGGRTCGRLRGAGLRRCAELAYGLVDELRQRRPRHCDVRSHTGTLGESARNPAGDVVRLLHSRDRGACQLSIGPGPDCSETRQTRGRRWRGCPQTSDESGCWTPPRR